MASNVIDDGNFHFPHYPLSGGQQMSDIKTLVLDSEKSSANETLPWAVKNGFVTVFGEMPNKAADLTWPAGSNAVLLGSLAGAARGTLYQKVDANSLSTLLLSFYSRVSIADPADVGTCPSSSLDVLLDNSPVGNVVCDTQWELTSMVVPLLGGRNSVDIGFKDSSALPPKADCVSAIAGVSLTAYTVDYLVKDSGDKQFTYLNEAFRKKLTVHPVDNLGQAVGGIPISFEVITGKVSLTAAHVTRKRVNGDPHTGQATIEVFGTEFGAATVKASAPGIVPVIFDLFVGPVRGAVDIICEPGTVTVRPVSGSDKATIKAASRPDSTPLPYFPLTKVELMTPYSFNSTVSKLSTTLGNTDLNGTRMLPKIYLKGAAAPKKLTVNYDGGSQQFDVIFRH